MEGMSATNAPVASPDPMPPHRALGLSDEEMDSIRELLGREPTLVELAMYSVMWSEHCSYKSSRAHLGKLPSEAPWVILGPGENAGVIDIGDGLVAALRIESHNHPSAVEPFQGAATGVGGIIRDILSMGARPVLLGDPLRFGPLVPENTPVGEVTEEDAARNRFLFKQVVAGISSYGNAVGVPTIGGEIAFSPCYSGNPLVNVFCLGLARKENLQRARATNPGDLAVLLGASTGRDGIGGVSLLASSGFDEDSIQKRPSVQVGDPFEEKKLIEACLEIFERRLASAIQDLGGAGLSCAASETAARGGTGIEIDVAAVHRREPGMAPEEVMTSESQERMFLTVPPHNLDEVLKVARRWGIEASVVGRVTDGSELTVYEKGRPVATVPAASLAEGPKLLRPSVEPERISRLAQEDVSEAVRRAGKVPGDLEALLLLVSDPQIGDSSWIWRQYDHQLFLNTVVGPGGEAAVVRARLPDERPVSGGDSKGGRTTAHKGLAVSFEGGGRLCYLDPYRGAQAVVAEACRKLACVGARPVALVDCLNFGNPENPEVMWEFERTVEGLAAACLAFRVPVVGGNVSFYNETSGVDIWPTPVVGALGILESLRRRPPGNAFAADDLVIYLLGKTTGDGLAGSAYAWHVLEHLGGVPPEVDLDVETRLQQALVEIGNVLTEAAEAAGRPPNTDFAAVHDLSDGGLAVALAESCAAGGVGAEVDLAPLLGDLVDSPLPPITTALFSETPGRVLVAVPEEVAGAVEAMAAQYSIPLARLGTTGGEALRVGVGTEESSSVLEVQVAELASRWQGALPTALGAREPAVWP